MKNPVQPTPRYILVRHLFKDRRFSRFVIAERSISSSPDDPVFSPIAEFRVEDQARKVCRLMNANLAMGFVTGADE